MADKSNNQEFLGKKTSRVDKEVRRRLIEMVLKYYISLTNIL